MGLQGMLTSPELVWLLAAVAKADEHNLFWRVMLFQESLDHTGRDARGAW